MALPEASSVTVATLPVPSAHTSTVLPALPAVASMLRLPLRISAEAPEVAAKFAKFGA
ncbi:hypothetical protein D3C86_2208710 [compost metagenome]